MKAGLNGKRKMVSAEWLTKLKNLRNCPFFIFHFLFSMDVTPYGLCSGMFVAFREELPCSGSLEGIE
jgi:hypothetical protein